ncbi:SAVED domain-containing protein [Actinacidiphila sp. ITFR-21]|uniref:SAVED domain-containing protein n=1 Tax=Actinacidiphila sp. ITFR-21 TaxID=3075199 RepID=UPI00288BA07D|nr:SAVED domain-containing protein [Streptomyces sp. ITFR-21]WNI16388.1 SAVED domain-containing protein [Streptomyces sp. ITFR-21]
MISRTPRCAWIPVADLLVLRPPAGVKDSAVPDQATANALAVGIRDAVRRASRTAPRVHLFLAGPMALTVMLGHRWNRVRPTTVYEDVATESFYERAFTIEA